MTTSDLSSDVHPELGGEYFFTPALKGLVQQLAHLAFFGDGMSVVIGAKGGGKTTLSRELLRHLDQAYRVVNIDLVSDMELGECVEKFSSALGLRCEESSSVGEMLAELRSFVQSLSRDKRLVVLIVDQAHYLDDQAVGALVSLLQGGTDAQSGLHLIFLSEPGLDKRIDALQILDVAVYRFDLPNFSPSELSSFLSKHSDHSSALNSSVVQKLWSGSQGLPGIALNLAQGKKAQEDNNDSRFSIGVPVGHIAAITVLVVVLLWSLFLREDDTIVETGPPLVTNTSQESPEKSEPQKSELEISESAEDSGGAVGFSTRDAVLETPEPLANEYEEENSENTFTETDAYSEMEASDNSQLQVEVDDVSRPVMPYVNEVNQGREDVAEANAPPSQDSLEEEGYSLEDELSEGVADELAQPVLEDEGDIYDEPIIRLTEAEVFLMAQNPDFYTLQVVAASKKASLKAYIQRQPNKSSLYMYRGAREAKSWFVIVQGVYSSREAALLAKRTLPSEQAKAGPWPRKLLTIQQEIEAFRNK